MGRMERQYIMRCDARGSSGICRYAGGAGWQVLARDSPLSVKCQPDHSPAPVQLPCAHPPGHDHRAMTTSLCNRCNHPCRVVAPSLSIIVIAGPSLCQQCAWGVWGTCGVTRRRTSPATPRNQQQRATHPAVEQKMTCRSSAPRAPVVSGTRAPVLGPASQAERRYRHGHRTRIAAACQQSAAQTVTARPYQATA